MRCFAGIHHINFKENRVMKSLFAITATALIAIIGILVNLSFKVNCSASSLADSEMQTIYGGCVCGPATYAAFRQDECCHTADYPQPCATDSCIANYYLDVDCPTNGAGNCSATIDPWQVCLVQYHRVSNGCTTNYPGALRTLYFHHLEHDCATREYRFRCDTTGCDGTLIEICIAYGLIVP